MSHQSPRIISLLPGTTEIICALGMESYLVGRSHECDYPSSVTSLPVCTKPKFNPDGTSYEIDHRMKALLQEGLSIYRVDADKLAELQPDVIITQDHCKACAASLPEVESAVKQLVDQDITLVSVSPSDLDGVYRSIEYIAAATGTEAEGRELIESMKNEFMEIQNDTSGEKKRTICCLEWLDPLMTAGNWIPELVDKAGGRALGATAGEHSPPVTWELVLDMNPEILAIIPCGYAIEQTLQEMDTLTGQRGWASLKAVQEEGVFILDGNQYFNRPGPRLTDSAHIMAEIIHPGSGKSHYRETGWIQFNSEKQAERL